MSNRTAERIDRTVGVLLSLILYGLLIWGQTGCSGVGTNTFGRASQLTTIALRVADATAEDAREVGEAAAAAEEVARAAEGQINLTELWFAFGDEIDDPDARLIGDLLLLWMTPGQDMTPPMEPVEYDARWHDFVQTVEGVQHGAARYIDLFGEVE